MLSTTGLTARTLKDLPDSFLVAEDEMGNEYVIDHIKKKCTHFDNPHDCHYALMLKKMSSNGCIKR